MLHPLLAVYLTCLKVAVDKAPTKLFLKPVAKGPQWRRMRRRTRRRHTWLAFSHLSPWAAAAKEDLSSVGFQHKEWLDLCFVVDFFSPKRSIMMKYQAILAALQVAPGHSSSTVYLLKKSKQTLGSTSWQLEPLREGKGAAAERCSSEGKGTLIPRAEGGFLPAFSARL